jgi:acyl-[acyl-carrier-protein] desaturase
MTLALERPEFVFMSNSDLLYTPDVAAKIYHLYREFFEIAEKRRRWSLRDDIPWDKCNPSGNPAVADVVESFCAVELFLPDYVAKILPHIRGSRGRAWFAFNWGYEESKHSLALGDWLLHSGMRSEEQMVDLENQVVSHEWNLPMDDPWGTICYSMVQELATWLHYRNLRHIVGPNGDPALYQLLRLVSVDERAHYDFFRKIVKIQLEVNREATLEQLRRVLNHFHMPAVYMMSDGPSRIAAVKALHVFDDEVFYKGVYVPILTDLGVTRAEMRNRQLYRKTLPSNTLV